MPLKCNIDARGRRIRLINGIIAFCLGIGALPLALDSGGRALWIISIVLLGMGAFSIFEALRGWCVLRALGIRTRF